MQQAQRKDRDRDETPNPFRLLFGQWGEPEEEQIKELKEAIPILSRVLEKFRQRLRKLEGDQD